MFSSQSGIKLAFILNSACFAHKFEVSVLQEPTTILDKWKWETIKNSKLLAKIKAFEMCTEQWIERNQFSSVWCQNIFKTWHGKGNQELLNMKSYGSNHLLAFQGTEEKLPNSGHTPNKHLSPQFKQIPHSFPSSLGTTYTYHLFVDTYPHPQIKNTKIYKKWNKTERRKD